MESCIGPWCAQWNRIPKRQKQQAHTVLTTMQMIRSHSPHLASRTSRFRVYMYFQDGYSVQFFFPSADSGFQLREQFLEYTVSEDQVFQFF